MERCGSHRYRADTKAEKYSAGGIYLGPTPSIRIDIRKSILLDSNCPRSGESKAIGLVVIN
jgi:hypothetical protein